MTSLCTALDQKQVETIDNESESVLVPGHSPNGRGRSHGACASHSRALGQRKILWVWDQHWHLKTDTSATVVPVDSSVNLHVLWLSLVEDMHSEGDSSIAISLYAQSAPVWDSLRQSTVAQTREEAVHASFATVAEERWCKHSVPVWTSDGRTHWSQPPVLLTRMVPWGEPTGTTHAITPSCNQLLSNKNISVLNGDTTAGWGKQTCVSRQKFEERLALVESERLRFQGPTLCSSFRVCARPWTAPGREIYIGRRGVAKAAIETLGGGVILRHAKVHEQWTMHGTKSTRVHSWYHGTHRTFYWRTQRTDWHTSARYVTCNGDA